jgi:hypothetical protein
MSSLEANAIFRLVIVLLYMADLVACFAYDNC